MCSGRCLWKTEYPPNSLSLRAGANWRLPRFGSYFTIFISISFNKCQTPVLCPETVLALELFGFFLRCQFKKENERGRETESVRERELTEVYVLNFECVYMFGGQIWSKTNLKTVPHDFALHSWSHGQTSGQNVFYLFVCFFRTTDCLRYEIISYSPVVLLW